MIPHISTGCTEIQSFRFPFAANEVEEVVVTYASRGQTLFEKRLHDCFISNNVLSVVLGQADTLAVNKHLAIYVQIRCKTKDGLLHASKVMLASSTKILNTEIL